jgi:hypothetical protein
MLEGAILLNDLKSDGSGGFFKYLREPGPNGFHSPYSIILATFSYALFGLDEVSPYYGNVLLVVMYLACLGWIFRSLPFLDWLIVLLLFLSPPFITMGVVEFRPDIAWAICTGFGVVFLVTADEIFRSPRRAAVAAFFFASALLVKPSTFVMTILLFSGAIASRVAVTLWEGRLRSSVRSLLLGIFVFVGVVIAVAGPYWWHFGKDAVNYFLENSFGANKAVWIFQGSLSKFLLYYAIGEGARSNVGLSGIILSLLSVGCLYYLFFRKRKLRWKIISLISLLAAAFLVNTAAQMKSAFLGGGIYGIWLFASAYLIARTCTVLRTEEVKDRTFWRNILLASTLLAVIFYRWPSYSDWGRDRVGSSNYREINQKMKSFLDQHADHPPVNILFSQAEPIVMEATDLWFAFHHLKVQNGSAAFCRNETEFKQSYPSYDWVVLQECGTMGFAPNMPSEPHLAQFAEVINADTKYEVIKEFGTGNGKKIWIYARKDKY